METIMSDLDDLFDEFMSAIDDLGDIEAADDFRESLHEKYDSMQAWYDEHGELTDAQVDAVKNMIDGARRWIR
jgi:hypothetical protein